MPNPQELIALAERVEALEGFLVFNVGCIECGVTSNVVGVYRTRGDADAIAGHLNENLSWREDGQNSFEVFDLSAEQPDEYTSALAQKETGK